MQIIIITTLMLGILACGTSSGPTNSIAINATVNEVFNIDLFVGGIEGTTWEMVAPGDPNTVNFVEILVEDSEECCDITSTVTYRFRAIALGQTEIIFVDRRQNQAVYTVTVTN